MSKKKTANRRDFLKLAGVAAPAAAAALVAPGAARAAQADAMRDPARGAGLRKTEHVRKYLESARF